jgi:hypothetical protein
MLTKGFSLQAIETKACARFSGICTDTISSLTSGLVRRLFRNQPPAWCGGNFSASLRLGVEAISPRASSLISVFPLELLRSAFCYCFFLVDSLLVIEMISFSTYMSIFFSVCTVDSSINHHLSHAHLVVSSGYVSGAFKFLSEAHIDK